MVSAGDLKAAAKKESKGGFKQHERHEHVKELQLLITSNTSAQLKKSPSVKKSKYNITLEGMYSYSCECLRMSNTDDWLLYMNGVCVSESLSLGVLYNT